MYMYNLNIIQFLFKSSIDLIYCSHTRALCCFPVSFTSKGNMLKVISLMYFTLSGSSIPFPSFPQMLDAILSVTVKSRLLRFAAKFICNELQFLSLITVLSWASAHPPILTILWLFMVLRVTATMLNSHVVNPKVQWAHIAAIVLMHFGHHDIRHQRFAHTCPWPRSQRSPLQHELQATTERCGNLATRLRVGPLCSTIYLFPLSGWPRQITDKPTMQVHFLNQLSNFILATQCQQQML